MMLRENAETLDGTVQPTPVGDMETEISRESPCSAFAKGEVDAVQRAGGSRTYRILKRAFDVVFSACVIVVGFIPGLILGVFISKDTGGSPIYSQERVGKGGRAFRIYKFRTMVADSDDVEKYLSAEQLEQWHRERKVDDDPRITQLGRKLRHTSIDEVPNFINVLKGDMSVVGPRAVSHEEIAWFGDDAGTVLSVPQGITGVWQCGPRNGATFENGERQRLELDYAHRASLRVDLAILLRTFAVMFVDRSGK